MFWIHDFVGPYIFKLIMSSIICITCDIASHSDLSRDITPETPLSEGLYYHNDIGVKTNFGHVVSLHQKGRYYYFTNPGGHGLTSGGAVVYGALLRSPSNPDYWILECFTLLPEGEKQVRDYWIVKIDSQNSHIKLFYIDYSRLPKEKSYLIKNENYQWSIANDEDTYEFLDYVLDKKLLISHREIDFDKIQTLYSAQATNIEDKPSLHALVIGVSNYMDSDLKLTYAAKDARDFAKGLKSLKGGLYADVDVTILVDGEATRSHILEDLYNLELHAVSRDINMIFISGHGFVDKRQNYWFLPVEATPDTIRENAVSQEEIRITLQDLAGKTILFLDTCYAGRIASTDVALRGAVDIDAVVKDFARVGSGVTTFASSISSESSQESAAWGNGAFTKALMEGLFDGAADVNHSGTITSFRLETYLEERVKMLTRGRQHPVMEKPPGIPDFPIALSGR